MRRGASCAIAALLVGALLAGCGDGAEDTATAPAKTGATAETLSPTAAKLLVKRFYGDYAKSYGGTLTSRGDSFAPADAPELRARAVRDHGSSRLAQTVSAAQGFDAVLCAPNVPASISVGAGVRRGDTVEVVTEHDYDGAQIRITAIVIATADGPRIDAIACPPG